MDPPEPDKPANVRELTDASLLAERARTDEELANARASVEDDADRVVAVARERAEALLLAAREQADEGLVGAPPHLRVNVEVERAAEDDAVSRERVVADAQLQYERDEGQRAISALLRLERAATDEGLLIERARADDVVQSRDDFLAMVSHDLRTLLGGIAMSASLLARHAVAPGDRDDVVLNHAERVQRFTARMTRLVGDLLDVVSLEAGKLHVAPLPHDAALLVTEAVDAFQASFGARGIALRADPIDAPLPARFDHDRLFQVLANLLSNALKFTETGSVTVRALRVGADVRFSVTDTGVGIPAGQAAVIFERFRQLDDHDRRGLGLGLYIARSIVEAHGGIIWAESPRTGGTTLYFTIPASAV